jgi:hypothetical protein
MWPNIRRVAYLEGDILVVHLKSGLKRGAEFDGQALLKGLLCHEMNEKLLKLV